MTMDRQQLHELAQRTRDPSALPDDVLAAMKREKVGPFTYDFLQTWQRFLQVLYAGR